MRSGTCPPGTCPVTNTCKYVVWHLSSWHLSGLYIYSPTYTHPPIVGMIYSIPTYIFQNVYSPTLRPKGAQKPFNLHSSPKCWHDISNTTKGPQLYEMSQNVGFHLNMCFLKYLCWMLDFTSICIS